MTPSTRLLVMSFMLVVSVVGCQQPEPPHPVGTPVPSIYAKCKEVGGNREVVCTPSLEELIVRPEWYDGAAVSVMGFLILGEEFAGLFASEDASRYNITGSVVAIELANNACPGTTPCRAFSGHWVAIRGKFFPRRQGGMVPTSGTITDARILYMRQAGPLPSLPQDRLNVPCVTRLQLPVYPPIAQSARVSASMTVAIVLSSSGSIQSIALEDVSGPRPDSDERIFRPELERALKASQFAPTCGGKTVRLSFAFQIDRHPPKSVWFEFPNRFEIAAAEAPSIDTGRQEPAPVR